MMCFTGIFKCLIQEIIMLLHMKCEFWSGGFFNPYALYKSRAHS